MHVAVLAPLSSSVIICSTDSWKLELLNIEVRRFGQAQVDH